MSLRNDDSASVETPRRTLAVVLLVVAIDMVGFGILVPVIPLYALSFGATEFVGSLLIAAYSLMQFLGAPVLGRLSDERGRRPVLLLSLAGSVIAWTLFGLAESLLVLFLARMLAGVMGGNIATAQAYIADLTPPKDRAKQLGFLGAAFGIGVAIGPAIGGVFSSGPVVAALGDVLPAFVPVSPFTLPSFAAAGITASNLALAAVVLPESRPTGQNNQAAAQRTTETDERRSRLRLLADALVSPTLGALIASFFLMSFAFSALESQFVFLTHDQYGFGVTENGVLFTYFSVMLAITQVGLIGPLTARFGEAQLAVSGAATMALTFVAIPFAPTLSASLPEIRAIITGGATDPTAVVVLFLMATPLALGVALTSVSLNTLVSQNTSDETQGSAFGLTQSAGSLARTIGPAVAGALYTGFAFWVPFVVAGVLVLPIVGLLRRVNPPSGPERANERQRVASSQTDNRRVR